MSIPSRAALAIRVSFGAYVGGGSVGDRSQCVAGGKAGGSCMRANQARKLIAALLVLGGCAADSTDGGPNSVVGSPITGSGGATGSGGISGAPHGSGGTGSFGNSGGTGGRTGVPPTTM